MSDAKIPRKLAENLEPDEAIIKAVKQQRIALEKPKWLVVTTRRIIVFDEKLLGRYELVSIPYEKLQRVYYRAGVIGSEFRLELEEDKNINLDWMDKDRAKQAMEAIKEALKRIAIEPP
ncbi:PH domain-containing protein [Hyperthermus butylicus]|uniref:Conserved archaeal protein n=1 Tax=Hyperthermus butylicus (strain DSM 5456 / JCM 9403 / PLM1-5) TaxID=415426 RepID=A2BKM8_HYPBU|nr:PH domain-containing protein [Hyperthermus butylicus]ABM80539.1 conserved archaeal protein [Hyperthermus butylicus DSM 5456]